jgi:hypothetical protein
MWHPFLWSPATVARVHRSSMVLFESWSNEPGIFLAVPVFLYGMLYRHKFMRQLDPGSACVAGVGLEF